MAYMPIQRPSVSFEEYYKVYMRLLNDLNGAGRGRGRGISKPQLTLKVPSLRWEYTAMVTLYLLAWALVYTW